MNLLQPPLLALLIADGLSLALLIPAGLFALRLLRHWDPASGSARQLRLEQQTYLVATIVAWVAAVQLFSLLLFVHTAEQLATQIVGAMCAVGALGVNAWGFPTLWLRLALFFVAATWLLLHSLDRRAPDYPLLRPKYRLLVLMVPLSGATAVSQWQYLRHIEPDVIASCCGSLFSPGQSTVVAHLTALPALPSLILFFGSIAVALGAGLIYLIWRRGLLAFSALTVLVFPTALIAIIAALSLYVYEHPLHHCPFCVLQPEYGGIGYALYLPLFLASTIALGLLACVLFKPRGIRSGLEHVLAQRAPHLVGLALLALLTLASVGALIILRSNLILLGY